MGGAGIGQVGLILRPRAVHQAAVAAGVSENLAVIASRHVYGAVGRQSWRRFGGVFHVRLGDQPASRRDRRQSMCADDKDNSVLG
jgi:hypothetical protein